MTIDKPQEPKIPEPPLGVSREILGDPCGGDGGGGGQNRMLGARTGGRRGSRSSSAKRMLGARTGGRRGSRSSSARRQMRDSGIEGRTGHARYAAEEVYRKNPRDGTWRRSGNQPGLSDLTHGGLWRPWVPQAETEEILQTTVSIADPSNHNHPVYYTSTDIRERAHYQKGKRYLNIANSYSIRFPLSDISEELRVERSKGFVESINKLSREAPGGDAFHDLGVSHENAGRHCPMCQLRGCCLGPNCLGFSGRFRSR